MKSTSTNAAVALKRITDQIRNDIEAATKSGSASLEAFRAVGEKLAEAKELLPRGKFGPWAVSEFGFQKEWRRCLLTLANDWHCLEQARSWAEANGRVLGRKEFSVNGAIDLIREWRTAIDPALQAARAEKRARRSRADAGSSANAGGADHETELTKLRRNLNEALHHMAKQSARIEALETELRAGIHPEIEPGVDDATKERARKAAVLWARGATDGECAAAESRLRDMAARCGLAFDAFLSECGIERPVHWTYAMAA